MTIPSPPDGRPLTALPTYNPSSNSPLEPLLVVGPPPTLPFPPPREHSVTRGRALSATSPHNASPRSVAPAAAPVRPKPSVEVDRKPSQYGHHRQTSIVHGVQHSRNPSLLAASAGTSPLSPQRILTSAGAHEPAVSNGVADLRKSPSLSTLHTNVAGGVALPPSRSPESPMPQRRPERMHSGKVKRSHEHQRSQSRAQVQLLSQPHQELRTVGEYALHHLFTSFIAEADERIERCIPRPGEPEPRVENICGPGADAAFDQLISSLGHINRHRPNSLIDSVIHWRKKKADVANQVFNELHALRESVYTTQRPWTNGSVSAPTSPPGGQEVLFKEHSVMLADRRSIVSIYILCRVLIEIIGQTTLKALNGTEGSPNTAGRLEDVIYGQLQSADPDLLANSPVIRANWVIRGQLLGVMSGIRFEEVAERYTRDLDRAQKRLSVKGHAEPKLAARTALLVQSMRWLKVRSHPEEAWNKSCDMLLLLASFFAKVHGRVMKHAYAELFEQLMLPIAATATFELNASKWKDVIDTLQPKIAQMLSKADHWPYVYPLQAVLLCVSPDDTFASQWLPLIVSFQPKSRDRAGRSHALKAICRLVWRYLYCSNDSPAAVAKKLDEIIKLVFQGGKRVLISTEPAIADPLIQLIRIIGFKHQDLCFRTIIFPLMNSELFTGSEKDLRIENLDPEKTVIAIRAFLAILADLEKAEPPPFPTSFECDALMDPASRSPVAHRRTRSQGFAVSAGRTERLSRPLITMSLDDVAKEYYVKFCKILGQLTIICDNTFGGQAVLDEKFASHTPKTPMAEAFTFSKRDDLVNPTDVRQHYYDLLHVAVQALPRCLSPQLPINSLVNLLCTGTAHVQSHIAKSSTQSLKSIARHSHAQQVTIGFARFIFNFDDRYATVSDGSLLGPGHIESTLKLYVELLQIWIDDIQRRTSKAKAEPGLDEESTRKALPLDLSGILAHVDEVESHGLFFLCSPSRAVRAVAVNVLRLITKFDTALDKPTTRIISILEGSSKEVIDVNDERLSLAERSRLQKGLRRSNLNNMLVELCSSNDAHDANLWCKIFPNLVRKSAEVCLHAVALTRELVCQRLSHSYHTINALGDPQNQRLNTNALEQAFANSRLNGRIASSSPDIIIEQWKIHLIFACTTLTNIGGGTNHLTKSSQSSQHTRKSSKSSSTSQEKMASASELFLRVVPLLQVPNDAVRAAAVAGLGATNVTLFRTLLETLHPYIASCTSDAKERIGMHQRSMSGPRRLGGVEVLRTELTHLLSLTCHLLKHPAMTGDDHTIVDDGYVLTYMHDYTKHLRLFLSDTHVQGELGFQKLRTHFCTLVETLYDCIRRLKDPSRWMSFQSRQATFALMENWCGFSPNEPQIRRREDYQRRSLLDQQPDHRSVNVVNADMEKEKHEVQLAALSAMATLCAGPLSFVADNKILMQFDVRRMLSWISTIFEAPSDRTHAIGRKALHNLIIHNMDQPYLMTQTLRMCYIAKRPKALASYFEVVTRVLSDITKDVTPFWKIICVGLYTLGNEDSQIRTKSARLLRALEERQAKTSKLQDLDISVSDKTTAVYKLAQFEVSRRLSKQHPELAFHVFSEFSAYFNELEPDHQRNMVSGMLPWIQTIELQAEPNGGPTSTSYMLLVNLFEITVKSSITLHNEIQALWQALATGPYGGNVQLVLEFIITICLDKKELSFVKYAKQVVVFLSKTPAGARVIDYLLMHISSTSMIVDQDRESLYVPVDVTGLPYIANLEAVLPAGNKQPGCSLGQLCMILLVDLVVSPIQLSPDKVPTLLQVILVQWDQNSGIVQDQAREMLVHLIHELVISKIEPGQTEPDKKSIEDFIELVRRNDPKVTWSYEESEFRTREEDTTAVSEPVAYVIDEVVKIFSISYPGIRDEWSKVSMHFANSCTKRHIACRSLQIFRCIFTSLDTDMIANMLARLSNVIADGEKHECLVFSLELLTTLRSIIGILVPEEMIRCPQLFWATCASLDAVFEREYQAGLHMLDLVLDKMDLTDPAIVKLLRDSQPPAWEGAFLGVHPLLYSGVRSAESMGRSLVMMERLIKMPSNEMVGGEDRMLFTVLANLPRFLHHFDDERHDTSCLASADALSNAAHSLGYVSLAEALETFAKGRYWREKDFLSHMMIAIKTAFFPAFEFKSLVFLLAMVNNQSDWFKVKTMQVLCVMIPEIDMRKPEIANQGPDLISPLLRLLQTEHCQQALDVLDNVIDMTGTPLDNKHLRMSMAGSHSSRATRKEYESTQSLYGIPEESGWSIPMPAKHSLQCRANIRAVCATIKKSDNQEVATSHVEFHQDELGYDDFAYRSMTMASEDTRADGTMSELSMKLDSLDDFFDDQVDMTATLDTESISISRYPSGLVEDLYDQQALPILHRSLNRNGSVTSFQTGLAERSYQPTREPTVMNPGAFAQSAAAYARPGLHSRSVTSPALRMQKALPRLQHDLRSGDEAGDEPDPFSDDDMPIGRTHTADEMQHSQSTVKPAGITAGLRKGLRRLTSNSGGREAREALKANAEKSPKVPKMPVAWLQGPSSADP